MICRVISGWSRAALAIVVGLWIVAPAFDARSSELTTRRDSVATRVLVDIGWVTLKNENNVGASGLSGGVGFIYGLLEKVGIQGYLQQAFSASDGFSSLYSAFEVGLTYAFIGSLKQSVNTVSLGGVPVYSENSGASPLLRVVALANQYFLNGSSRVLGLSGFGGALYYSHPLSGRLALSSGIKVAIASSGSTTIYPIQVVTGVSLIIGGR